MVNNLLNPILLSACSLFDQTYKITWNNEGGQTLAIDEGLTAGIIPSYEGPLPFKASTDEYDYEFIGWKPKVKVVTKNQVYTAVFVAVEIPQKENTMENLADPLVFELLENNTYMVKGFASSSLRHISIPKMHEGLVVSEISANAFSHSYDCHSITIPSSVTKIGDFAFCYTDTLTNINVSEYNLTFSSVDGVLYNKEKSKIIKYPEGKSEATYEILSSTTTIADYAFSNTKLESIVIPNGVVEIGDFAFCDANNLTKITIPSSLTKIEDNTFSQTKSLVEIVVSEENQMYSAVNGILFNKNKNRLIKYPEAKTDTVYEVSEGVTRIGSAAFFGASNLEKIKISSTVTDIGKAAFAGTSRLKNILVDANNKTYTISGGVLYDKEISKLIKYLEISGAILFTIPDGVTTIESYAFYGVHYLIQITIPSSLKSIGSHAFYKADSLGNINIPEGVTRIEDYTFYGMHHLSEITLPSSLESIGSYAFYEARSLRNIDIPAGLTKIEDYTFYGARSLVSINIPDSITSIGDYAFYGTHSLVNVVLPKGIKKIGDHAFSEARSLESIDIPEGIEKIADYAFSYTTSLVKINLPRGITSIGDYAFIATSSLLKIEIPNSVVELGQAAFLGSAISEVIFEKNSQIKKIRPLTFASTPNLTNVTIPNSVVNIETFSFFSATNLTNIELSENLVCIGLGAFYQTSLTSIVFPQGLINIGPGAFAETALTHVVLPANLTSLEPRAFALNSSLKAIDVASANNTYVSLNGVVYNKNMTELIIYPLGKEQSLFEVPASVTKIGAFAFTGGEELISIILPNKVRYIDPEAFYHSEHIKIFSHVSVLEGVVNNEIFSSFYYTEDWHYDKDGNPIPND